MRDYGAPIDVIESLQRYVNNKIPTGGFLHALLANDLRETFARADGVNITKIFQIVCYCWNEIPAVCWGSYEKVDEWLKGDDNGEAK